MSVRRVGWASLLALIAVVAVPHLAAAAEFSADVVMSGTGMSATSTIYVKGRSLRMDLVQGQQKRIMIINADKKMLWSIDPATKTYMGKAVTAEMITQNMDQLLRGKLPPQVSKGATVKRLGTETVSGYPCEKTQTQTQSFTTTTWYSKKLDLALRLETKSTQGQQYRQEVKNIKVGSQPASLFVVPKGYKEVKAPQGAAGPGGPAGRRGAMRRPPSGR